MSDNEKAAQIGEAMLLLEAQKRELAHLTEKMDRVKKAYRAFASNSERWRVDQSRPGQIFLAHPSADERDLPAYLLCQSDLAALIAEHQAAEEALKATKSRLAGFGVIL